MIGCKERCECMVTFSKKSISNFKVDCVTGSITNEGDLSDNGKEDLSVISRGFNRTWERV